MITREKKAKILERFQNKDEKMLISNLLDKAYQFEREDKLFYTTFFNLHELKLATAVLNETGIPYTIFSINEQMQKKIIFFLPEYMIDIKESVFAEYVKCIKITQNSKEKLRHQDYMGAIYSLGIKNEMIGDIFVLEKSAYVFCMKSVANYLLEQLWKVAKQEVKTKIISFEDEEIKNLKLNFITKEYIVASLRVDAILSVVYQLSRKEAKEKIIKGDLWINDRNIFYPNELLKNGDIVSLRKCGKLKMGEIVRKTRSENYVVLVSKYS